MITYSYNFMSLTPEKMSYESVLNRFL